MCLITQRKVMISSHRTPPQIQLGLVKLPVDAEGGWWAILVRRCYGNGAMAFCGHPPTLYKGENWKPAHWIKCAAIAENSEYFPEYFTISSLLGEQSGGGWIAWIKWQARKMGKSENLLVWGTHIWMAG